MLIHQIWLAYHSWWSVLVIPKTCCLSSASEQRISHPSSSTAACPCSLPSCPPASCVRPFPPSLPQLALPLLSRSARAAKPCHHYHHMLNESSAYCYQQVPHHMRWHFGCLTCFSSWIITCSSLPADATHHHCRGTQEPAVMEASRWPFSCGVASDGICRSQHGGPTIFSMSKTWEIQWAHPIWEPLCVWNIREVQHFFVKHPTP